MKLHYFIAPFINFITLIQFRITVVIVFKSLYLRNFVRGHFMNDFEIANRICNLAR